MSGAVASISSLATTPPAATRTPASTTAQDSGRARPATVPTFPVPATARIHSTATSTVPGTPASTTPTSAQTTPTTATTATTAAPTGSATGAAQPLTSTIPTTSARTGAHAGPRGSGHVSTEAIVIAAIAVLLLLACAIWAFARSRAYEPHWWLSLRHAMAEAGYRMSATWAEFADWARLGR